jgi:siroheme synthase
LAPTTPAVIASNISRPDQRLILSRLDQLEQTQVDNETSGPVLIIVGDVLKQARMQDEHIPTAHAV